MNRVTEERNHFCCDTCNSHDIGSWDQGTVWFCRDCQSNDIRPYKRSGSGIIAMFDGPLL